MQERSRLVSGWPHPTPPCPGSPSPGRSWPTLVTTPALPTSPRLTLSSSLSQQVGAAASRFHRISFTKILLQTQSWQCTQSTIVCPLMLRPCPCSCCCIPLHSSLCRTLQFIAFNYKTRRWCKTIVLEDEQ